MHGASTSKLSQAKTIGEVISQGHLESSELSEEAEDEERTAVPEELIWKPVTGVNLKTFEFSVPNPGIPDEIVTELVDKTPYEFFKYFLSDKIIQHMVVETNRYAQQIIESASLSRHSRLIKWKNVSSNEIEIFLGIIFWMGLNKKPKLSDYWSKKLIYENRVTNIMSRNRFELILRMWHFSNNQECTEGDRLFKIQPLIDLLLERFQLANIPNKDICIDETLVPFRGKLSFKQFIKNKRHKFGIKLYKLCSNSGYTYNLKVYCGRDAQPGLPVGSSVVMDLTKNLLDAGRVLYTDNFYTSIYLAHELLNRSTHLVGTLRTNRKLNPKEVTQSKLKKGEKIARESNTGVVVLKWKDKRDVLMLTTTHDDTMLNVQSENGKSIQKPQVIIDYNNSKAFIDLSDQMKAYSTALRRGVKWYRKLAIELITGSALVNAHILYKNIKKKKCKITHFKEELTMKLLQLEGVDIPAVPTGECSLKNMGTIRRRCTVCYEKLKLEFGRKHAGLKAKQTPYKCEKCDSFFCVECFFSKHKSFKL